MARNGAGTYVLPTGQPVVTGTTISSTTHNTLMSDVANALTTSIANDGQTTPTANLPMGNFKFTGLGAGTTAGNSLRFEQLFSQGSPVTIASAATVDIGGQTTVAIEISGTTTITSFGTNYNGPRFLRFTGALLLTHNATTLNLPGAANITTVAGDTCIAYPNLTGNGWNVFSYTRASFAPLVLQASFNGFTMSTAGASATMSFTAGQATDSTGSVLISVAALDKTTSAWAVGTGTGGLDTGSIANNTWYHFYAIRRPDTGVTGIIFSLSASAPTLPTNYTQYVYINSGRTNGSAQWTKFVQNGSLMIWDVWPNELNASNPATAATLLTVSTPLGIKCEGIFSAAGANGSVNMDVSLSDPAITATTPSSTNNTFRVNCNTAVYWSGTLARVMTDTSSRIRYQCSASGASNTLTITTQGWVIVR